jgi:hypothetical protein
MLKYYGIYRSKAYLKWVRDNPCALCPAAAAQAHHEPLGENYVGGKPPDSHAIPLCSKCHGERHQYGPVWINKQLDVKKLIIKLLTRYVRELEGKNGKE